MTGTDSLLVPQLHHYFRVILHSALDVTTISTVQTQTGAAGSFSETLAKSIPSRLHAPSTPLKTIVDSSARFKSTFKLVDSIIPGTVSIHSQGKTTILHAVNSAEEPFRLDVPDRQASVEETVAQTDRAAHQASTSSGTTDGDRVRPGEARRATGEDENEDLTESRFEGRRDSSRRERSKERPRIASPVDRRRFNDYGARDRNDGATAKSRGRGEHREEHARTRSRSRSTSRRRPASKSRSPRRRRHRSSSSHARRDRSESTAMNQDYDDRRGKERRGSEWDESSQADAGLDEGHHRRRSEGSRYRAVSPRHPSSRPRASLAPQQHAYTSRNNESEYELREQTVDWKDRGPTRPSYRSNLEPTSAGSLAAVDRLTVASLLARYAQRGSTVSQLLRSTPLSHSHQNMNIPTAIRNDTSCIVVSNLSRPSLEFEGITDVVARLAGYYEPVM